MTDDIRTRLDAVERAVADGETDLANLADAASVERRLTAVEERLDAVEARLDTLDATTQAVRGYLSGVDGVTDDVERQAALALAKAEAVEAHVFDADERAELAVERVPTTDGRGADRPHDEESDARGRDAESTDPTPDVDNNVGVGRPSSGVLDDARTEPCESSLVTRLRDAL
jgi:ABC-type transporter Mla subunit MlaD